MVKPGTKWTGSNGEMFRVLGVTEIEGKSWVFYKAETPNKEPNEFSCLEESFVFRFRPHLNE